MSKRNADTATLPVSKQRKLDDYYQIKNTLKLEDLFRRSNDFDTNDASYEHNVWPRRLGRSGGNDFFTLRLEHREGGVMAKYKGEERILIFCSDRPGAIGKIIFSSTPAHYDKNEDEDVCMTDGKNDDFDSYDESQFDKMAQAKIHLLDIKEEYRARDLGGLLFSEAALALQNRYYEDENDTENNIDPAGDLSPSDCRLQSLSSSVWCQLDAEEDTRRYNKLIHFYEKLGCRVKPHAKVRFLNNNDGETYRSIPMQIALRGYGFEKNRKEKRQWSSLVGQSCGFLPVDLLEPNGRRASVLIIHSRNKDESSRMGKVAERKVNWLIVEDGENGVLFRTTQGQSLFAYPDGKVVATDGEDMPLHDWEYFKLCKVPDRDGSDSEQSDMEQNNWQKELWLLQSSHGTFLSADPDTLSLSCSKYPSFWQADGNTLSLRCTRDTPPRRQHYRKTWMKQSVDYVQTMRERYLNFQLKKMSLREALEMATGIPRHPFKVTNNGTSLRSFLFYFAEACRKAGHPDWIQLICLVHELGRVVNCIDISTAMNAQDYDWTITIRSRVVGCMPPETTYFSEFSYLNPDLGNNKYNTTNGMYEDQCGMKNLLLLWTGPEYMYFMLKRNGVRIPDDGLAILKLFSLVDWHSKGKYARFASENDECIRPLVADFDRLRRKVKSSSYEELSDSKCDELWEKYYLPVVLKYGCDGDLNW